VEMGQLWGHRSPRPRPAGKAIQQYSNELAEGEGFEPPVPFRAQWFSRPPPSTTRPSLPPSQAYSTTACYGVTRQSARRRDGRVERSGLNPRDCCKSKPMFPVSVTGSVTIATARDDAGPQRGAILPSHDFHVFREPPGPAATSCGNRPGQPAIDSPPFLAAGRAEGSAASEFFDNNTRPQWVMTYTHTLTPNA
jgi:hypothetical protein